MTDTPPKNDTSDEPVLAESASQEAIAPTQADELVLLAEQVKKQEEEIARLKDQYLRAVAETENVRTRARRDIEDTGKYAATKFARDMVGLIENLGRASQSVTAEARAGNPIIKQVGDGIDMTMQELLSMFERHGIKRVSPLGEKFDHNFHQAVAQVPTADAAPGTVVQVLQAGYILHDRLLRPAMVNVAIEAKSGEAAPMDKSA